MQPIQLRSEVGSDGVLSLQVPMGEDSAQMEVVVTIAGVEDEAAHFRPVTVNDWHTFVAQTYGSCADFGLEEPADLPLQDRALNG